MFSYSQIEDTIYSLQRRLEYSQQVQVVKESHSMGGVSFFYDKPSRDKFNPKYLQGNWVHCDDV